MLTVVCEPECDALFIDNQQQASPTAAAKIHPGTHAIAAAKAGYLGQAKKVTLTAGQNETVVFKLPKRATAPAKTTKPCGNLEALRLTGFHARVRSGSDRLSSSLTLFCASESSRSARSSKRRSSSSCAAVT